MRQQVHGGDIYRHKEVIDFSSNMNPLGTPASVIEAARASMMEIENYPDIQAEELIRCLSLYEGVEGERIICGNGAAELIFTFALALRPKKALLLAPTFAEYEQALTLVGTEVRYYMLKEESSYSVQEDILDAITDDTDLVLICNPNNPTGMLTEKTLLEKVLETCKKKDCFLLIDECFQDFIDDHQAYTLKDHLDSANLFILKAFTKRYAMAGIRLGYGLCGNQSLLDTMQMCVQPWNVSIPAQAAGVAALKEVAYVEKAREILKVERAFLKKGLKEKGFEVFDSKANYIFFKGPQGLPEKVLKNGIMIRDCSNYVNLTSGYYRVAVRSREDNEKLLQAL